jgi:hypothetical protein
VRVAYALGILMQVVTTFIVLCDAIGQPNGANIGSQVANYMYQLVLFIIGYRASRSLEMIEALSRADPNGIPPRPNIVVRVEQ